MDKEYYHWVYKRQQGSQDMEDNCVGYDEDSRPSKLRMRHDDDDDCDLGIGEYSE